MDTANPRCDELKRRALKLAKKGEPRKAALVLRERASLLDEPAAWVMAGAMMDRARRKEDALAALRHGMWLHEQRGQRARARSVAKLVEAIDPEDKLVRRLRKAG